MTTDIAGSLMNAGMSEAAAEDKAAIFAALDRYQRDLNRRDAMRWFVPGRIEVLGKHTDYAGGRSLLCTAERGFCVDAVPRRDSIVRIYDVGRSQSFEFNMSADLAIPGPGWRAYPAVVARRLARNFRGAIHGADIALASDLPAAAGMSSSSALVIAIYAILSAVNGIAEREEYTADIHSAGDLAGYLGCIESGQSYKSLTGDGGVGTFGGSEDHTAILVGEPGRLKQYSFCPVRLERTVQLPEDCVFVIGVSGVVADKTGSAKASYNRASQGVRSILEIWRSASGSKETTLATAACSSADTPDRIRDALRRANPSDADSIWLLNRFEQFWLESERIIPAASEALGCGDLRAFGKLVDESQAAAETLLGNQVPETIWLARRARALGAHAASAFGAGFGGSVWALVPRTEAVGFDDRWRQAYGVGWPQLAVASQFFTTGAGPAMLRLG